MAKRKKAPPKPVRRDVGEKVGISGECSADAAEVREVEREVEREVDRGNSQEKDTEDPGDVSAAVATLERPTGESVAREETRAQATNRWILEGRRWDVDRRRKDLIRQGIAAGMTREAAADRAWDVVLAEFPPPGVEPCSIPAPDPAPPPPEPAPEQPAGVQGLGDLPPDWPALPANASLQAEVGWVQAWRVAVVEPLPGGGARVHLDRAAPAPSMAALAWLETSILYPSKWADVALRATQHQADEQEHIRKEKMAIADMEALLAEMRPGPPCPTCGQPTPCEWAKGR